MAQAPEPPTQPPPGPPVAVPAAAPPLVARNARLYQAAAWVVIVAGTVFVLGVVFFAGAELSGHGRQYRHDHHGVFGPDSPTGPDGPPPWVVFPGGPFPPGSGPRGVPGARVWVRAGLAVMVAMAAPKSPLLRRRPTRRSGVASAMKRQICTVAPAFAVSVGCFVAALVVPVASARAIGSRRGELRRLE